MYSVSDSCDGCHSACSFPTSSLSFPLAAAQIPLWFWLQSTTLPGLGRSCHTDGFGGAEERAALRNPALTALWGVEGPTCPLQIPVHLFALHVLTDIFLNKTRVWCVKRHEDHSSCNPAGPSPELLCSCAVIFAPPRPMAWPKIWAIYQARGLKKLRQELPSNDVNGSGSTGEVWGGYTFSFHILTFFLTSPSYLGTVLFTWLKPHPHFQKYTFTLRCAQSGKHQYLFICESFWFCSLLATPFLLIRCFPLLSFSSPAHLSDPCLFIFLISVNLHLLCSHLGELTTAGFLPPLQLLYLLSLIAVGLSHHTISMLAQPASQQEPRTHPSWA